MSVILEAGVGLASAAGFAFVGAKLLRRKLPAEHEAAGLAFGLAWLAACVSALATALAALGLVDRLLAAWTALAFGVALCGGTVAYLAYLLTGRRLAVPVTLAAYGVLLVAAASVITALDPHDASASAWMTRFQFDDDDARLVSAAISAAVLGPLLLASVGYLRLLRVAATRTARWRVALVGSGLALWSSAALAARIVPAEPMGALARATGALLAVAVVLAYAPPAWAARRWGIQRIDAELPASPLSEAERVARVAAMTRRAQELI